MLFEELSRSWRLRQDLHDGLGPTLSGIGHALEAARTLVRTDPDAAMALLRRLRRELGDAATELRRLVDGLRPSALDELGLLGAVRLECTRLSTRDSENPLLVTVSANDALPEMPSGVEVAAYRIAIEAMTNAARHSGARHVEVRIVAGDELVLRVIDDGTPRGTPWTPGMGLVSMAERATEVGGHCTAGPTPTGGRVTATFPLA